MLVAKCGIAGTFLFLFLFVLAIATQDIFYFQCALWAGFYVIACIAGAIIQSVWRIR